MGDQLCMSVQQGNKVQAVTEQNTAHSGQNKWTFYFLQLSCWSISTKIFILNSILVTKGQLKTEKRRSWSIFKCQVPQVSLPKPAFTEMLSTDLVTNNTKMISKFKSPLSWPDKQLVTPVANIWQIRILAPLSNHTQPLGKTELRVITKRKLGTTLMAQNQHEGYKESIAFLLWEQTPRQT